LLRNRAELEKRTGIEGNDGNSTPSQKHATYSFAKVFHLFSPMPKAMAADHAGTGTLVLTAVIGQFPLPFLR
jgi:hypothetical protein